MDWHQLPRPQKSIGFYRMSVADASGYGGGYTMRIPVYDVRQHVLEMTGEVVDQVKVEAFGGFCWINVNATEVELH